MIFNINVRGFGMWIFIFLIISQITVAAENEIKKMMPVTVQNVRVGGEMGRRIDEALENNILKLDVDKYLLDYFRNREGKIGYVGLGKLIDAFVYYSVYTKNNVVVEKKDYLVKTIIELQEEDGYIGLMNKSNRMFGGADWDIHEMSYIIYSLSQNFRYFGDKASLESEEKAAKYIISHWSEKHPDWQDSRNIAETVAFTGLEEAMVNLFDLTRKQEYLNFLLNERDLKNWDLDIVIGRKPLIEGHIYSFLSRILAQLKLYALEPSPELLEQTAKVFDFLINKDGMVITGGAGQIEIWDDSQDGSDFLAESCATAYFMRVCNQLVQLTGDSFFGDLMERTLYNSLFGAWAPDCSLTRYFTPFEGPRVFSEHASYCCSNNLRRILPALPGMVYYTGWNSLAVNFYVESEAETIIDGIGVKIQQITDYPSTGAVKIKLSPESENAFNIMLRIPKWNKKAELLVNGEKIEITPASGQFFVLNRIWKKGDEVEIHFEMQPRLIAGVKKQAGRAALIFGP